MKGTRTVNWGEGRGGKGATGTRGGQAIGCSGVRGRCSEREAGSKVVKDFGVPSKKKEKKKTKHGGKEGEKKEKTKERKNLTETSKRQTSKNYKNKRGKA